MDQGLPSQADMSGTRTIRRADGFSSLELLLVVAIMGILSAITLIQIGQAQPALKGDGALRTVIAQMNIARERSITERRVIEVAFVNGNVIRLTRRNVPASNGTTVIAQVPIEGGAEFVLTPGLPDTPDQFGNGAAVSFGSATTVAFTSDGTFISNSGTPVNGTVFLRMRGMSDRSSRAVTVMGNTGTIRGYKWDGRRWVRA